MGIRVVFNMLFNKNEVFFKKHLHELRKDDKLFKSPKRDRKLKSFRKKLIDSEKRKC